MKITKGTIIRTILFIIVVINIFLERKGVDLIPTDGNAIATLLEIGIEAAIMVVGFWKNNSYSQAAIKADKFLKELRETNTEWNYDEFESEVE
jgi:SPP1 family holin